MIARAAREIAPGMVVNLGIGLPTKVLDHLAPDFPVCLHTENGLTGIGPTLPYDRADRNLIDAGGAYVSTIPGSAFFDSATSFALVRSGRLDLPMLGAFEVAQIGGGDGHEGQRATVREVMNRACNQRLAGPAFTRDQHRQIGVHDPRHEAVERLHDLRPAHQRQVVVPLVHLFALFRRGMPLEL